MSSSFSAKEGDPGLKAVATVAVPDPKSSDMFRYNIFKNVGATNSATKAELESTLADLSVADSKHDFTHGLKSITDKLNEAKSSESKMYQTGIPVNYTHYLDEDKALSSVIDSSTFKFDNTDKITDTTGITKDNGYTPYKVVDCLKTGDNSLITAPVKHSFTTINGNRYIGTFIDVKPATIEPGSDGNYRTTRKGSLISGKKLLKAMGYPENYNGSICFGVDCVSINLETIFNTSETATTTGFDVSQTKLFLALTRAKFNDPGGQTNVKSTTFRSLKGINYKPLVPINIENSDSYGYIDDNNKLPADSFFTKYRFNLSLELKLTVPCFSSYKSTLQINPSHLEKIKPTIIPNSGYMNEINEVIKIILDVMAKISGRGPTNIDAFNFNCGYQGKRSGDWLQALAVAEMCLGLTKYQQYNVESRISFIDMFKTKNFSEFLIEGVVDTSETWLVTHDRLLFAFGLLLGLNMVLTHHYKKTREDVCSYHSAIIYKIEIPSEARDRKLKFLNETYAKIIVGNGTVSFLANDIGNLLKRFKETETEVSKKLNGTRKTFDNIELRYGLIGQLNEKIVDATTKFNPDGGTGKIQKTDVETLTQSIFSLAFEISMIKEIFPNLGVVDAEAQDFIQSFTQLNTNINIGGPDIVMDSAGEPFGLKLRDGQVVSYEELSKLMSTYYSLKAKYEGLITKNQDETQKFLSGYSRNLKNNPAFSLISKWTASDKPKNNLWVLAKSIFSTNASFINDKNVFLYKLTKLDDDLKRYIFELYSILRINCLPEDIIQAGSSSLAAKTRENILSFCVEVIINLATGDTALQVKRDLPKFLDEAKAARDATLTAASRAASRAAARDADAADAAAARDAAAAADPATNRILNPVDELNDLTRLGPTLIGVADPAHGFDYTMGTISLPITDTTIAAPVLALASAAPPPVETSVVSQFVLQDAVEKLMSIKAISGADMTAVTDDTVDTSLSQLVARTDGYKTIDLSTVGVVGAVGPAETKINSLRAENEVAGGVAINNGEIMIGGNNKLHYNTTFSIDNKEVPRTIILANLFIQGNGSVEAIINYVTERTAMPAFNTDEDRIDAQTELKRQHSGILGYNDQGAEALINIDRVSRPVGAKVGGPSMSSSSSLADESSLAGESMNIAAKAQAKQETVWYIVKRDNTALKILDDNNFTLILPRGNTIAGRSKEKLDDGINKEFVIKVTDTAVVAYPIQQMKNNWPEEIKRGITIHNNGGGGGINNNINIYSPVTVKTNQTFNYFTNETSYFVVSSKVPEYPGKSVFQGINAHTIIELHTIPPLQQHNPGGGSNKLQKGGAIKEEIDELIQKPENILKGEKFGSQPLTPIYLLLESFCFELNVSDIESSWDYEIFTQFFVIANKLIYELTNKYLKEQDGESNTVKNTKKLKALVNGYGLRELIYTSPQYIERDDVCKKVLKLDNSSDNSYGLLSKVFSLLVNRVCGSIHQSDEEIAQGTSYIDNPIFKEYVGNINFQEILDSNVQYEKAFEMSVDANKLFLKVGDCITLDIYGKPSLEAYQELLNMTESAQSKYLLPNDSGNLASGFTELVGAETVNQLGNTLGNAIGDITTDFKKFTDAVTKEPEKIPIAIPTTPTDEQKPLTATRAASDAASDAISAATRATVPVTSAAISAATMYSNDQAQKNNFIGIYPKRPDTPSPSFQRHIKVSGGTRKRRFVKVPKITRNQKLRKRKQTRNPRRKQTRRTNKRTRKHRN